MTSNYTFADGHSQYIDGADKAWTYLDRFREASEGLVDGIRLLTKTDPGTALGFVCLLEGAIDQVLPLLHGKAPHKRAPDYFPTTEILGPREIEEGLAQLRPANGKLAWTPAH